MKTKQEQKQENTNTHRPENHTYHTNDLCEFKEIKVHWSSSKTFRIINFVLDVIILICMLMILMGL